MPPFPESAALGLWLGLALALLVVIFVFVRLTAIVRAKSRRTDADEGRWPAMRSAFSRRLLRACAKSYTASPDCRRAPSGPDPLRAAPREVGDDRTGRTSSLACSREA